MCEINDSLYGVDEIWDHFFFVSGQSRSKNNYNWLNLINVCKCHYYAAGKK